MRYSNYLTYVLYLLLFALVVLSGYKAWQLNRESRVGKRQIPNSTLLVNGSTLVSTKRLELVETVVTTNTGSKSDTTFIYKLHQ